MTQDAAPDIAAEIARLLTEQGWTVRRLKTEAGFGSSAAEALLGKIDSLPSLESAERALALLKPPRQLWHRKQVE